VTLTRLLLLLLLLQTVICLIVSFVAAMVDLGTMALADETAHILQVSG
jgi:hypothetical protein